MRRYTLVMIRHVGAAVYQARAIPGARLVTHPGMGHDLPQSTVAIHLDEICARPGGDKAGSDRVRRCDRERRG